MLCIYSEHGSIQLLLPCKRDSLSFCAERHLIRGRNRYTFSLSVLLQSLIIVSMSGAADHGIIKLLVQFL